MLLRWDLILTSEHVRLVDNGCGREEASPGEVIYPRGSIAELPEAHASRKERFMELDDLQPGWEVELRGRKGGTTVDASFFSPTGVLIECAVASSICEMHRLLHGQCMQFEGRQICCIVAVTPHGPSDCILWVQSNTCEASGQSHALSPGAVAVLC